MTADTQGEKPGAGGGGGGLRYQMATQCQTAEWSGSGECQKYRGGQII